MTAFDVRGLTGADLPFLQLMLREASCWDEDPPHTSVAEVLADPALARYVDSWGRAGDAGVVAAAGDGQPLGAAWYRLFDDNDRGFGFVSKDIPELGIAVVSQWRGLGAGAALLRRLVEVARLEGHAALSLSVDDGNARARALYERSGFTNVERVGDSWTMLREL
jgi:GNAT superfamily N-acetyltransferase